MRAFVEYPCWVALAVVFVAARADRGAHLWTIPIIKIKNYLANKDYFTPH